ncbi:MAG: hypothetical protein WBG08_06895 [Litorimonas sp.]
MKAVLKTSLGLATAALFAGTAQAGMTDAKTKTAATDTNETTRAVQTLDADGRVGQLTLVEMNDNPGVTAVLGALALQTTDAYIVQDNDGAIYINHLVPVEDLQDPTLTVETVETYEIVHNGRTYTNKIVDPR